MTDAIDAVGVFLSDYFGATVPNITPTDVVEILLIALFFYKVLQWIKDTRAWMLFRGILVIILFFILAAAFRMSTILWLGEKLISAGAIALVVVFQPELRTALEQLGRNNLWNVLANLKLVKGVTSRFDDKTRNDLVKAAYEMGAVKTGALIVIERDVQLTEYIRTGIMLDSILSRQLLINIFEKNTPLHDGAVIVRGNRVVAATCYLPLSDNMELSKDLGTRHRAAVGISEVCDGVTIVVSEETGNVSIAADGILHPNVSMDELNDYLTKLQALTVLEEEGQEGAAEKLKKSMFGHAKTADEKSVKSAKQSNAKMADSAKQSNAKMAESAKADTVQQDSKQKGGE